MLKTYNTEWRELYEFEVRLYSLASPSRDEPPLFSYWGSFEQCGDCNVLSEYSEYESLEYFFNTVPPPSDRPNVLVFWLSMLRLLDRLSQYHANIEKQLSSLGPVPSIHIAPNKMLVYNDLSNLMRFDIRFAELLFPQTYNLGEYEEAHSYSASFYLVARKWGANLV